MKSIVIRNLTEEEAVKLKRLAEDAGISREEYVRRILRRHLLAGGVKEVEEKYANLVLLTADVVENNTRQLEEIMEKLEEMKTDGQEDIPYG